MGEHVLARGSRAAPGAGRQLGLLWAGLALVLLAAAPFAGWIAAQAPACPFRSLTGIPCATCGATSAAVALSQLDIAGALMISPLAAIGWMAFIAGGVVAGVAALAGRGVPELPRELPWAARVGIVAVVAANWGYLILR